ncbi:MAG: hypothetical protein OEW00_04130 [candidate division Zixibacteria bacterium]|nr:hypothetical protein [candidate division Zixibacteria bacterium]
MKGLVFVLAVGLILTGALYGEAFSRNTPYDYVDPSRVGPNDDHPWGGDQDDGDDSNDPNSPKSFSHDMASGIAPLDFIIQLFFERMISYSNSRSGTISPAETHYPTRHRVETIGQGFNLNGPSKDQQD